MGKSELDKEQKDLLKDINAFNNSVSQQGWHLKDKKLDKEILKGIRLNNSSMDNVDMLEVDISNSTIQKSTFSRVDLRGANFTNAVLREVEFRSCDFGFVDFGQTEFVDCVFHKCQAQETQMEKAVFRGCTFESYSDKDGVLDSATFSDCNFVKPRFDNTSLYYAQLEKVEMSDGVVENTIFAGTGLRQVSFSKINIDFCSFNESTVDQLVFEECRSQRISFGKASIKNLKFTKCDNFSALNIIKSECQGLIFADCPLISEPMFYLSIVNDFSITNSCVEYLEGEESTYGGANLIRDSKISGANFSQSKVSGLTVENTTLFDYLVLDEGEFSNLTLRNVKYDDKLEIDAKDVKYTESDEFAKP